LTLACLQDLSQARDRWGPSANGFLSLFGTKVLLPGIADIRTLEAASRLAGQTDVVTRSVNTSAWWSAHPSVSTTHASRRQPRLPVDQAHSLPAGAAIVIAGAQRPQLTYLTTWWDYPPFRDARLARLPANWPPPDEQRTGVGSGRVPVPPSPTPGARQPSMDEVAVRWRRAPGQSRLRPPPPLV